jgi:hypothetical protein
MDSRLKYIIIQDYITSFNNFNKIASGKEPNWFVLKPNQYLTPTIMTKEVSLDNENGEFNHYNQICETLEKLLAGENINYTCHFSNAPEEIKQLFNKAA